MGGLWANPAFGNFDDIAAAALLLFEMAGMEGWPDVMYQGIDAVGVDEAPVRDASVASGLFFVLWIVVGPRTPPYPNPNPNPSPSPNPNPNPNRTLLLTPRGAARLLLGCALHAARRARARAQP